ncbi:hypothetical protein M9Y10_038040 [Tritrichomonas musculus]|uniref:Uncharacterized protein n=1 Tax=Tritrichomonas musculus TaxID=1915356 RepID=A0ABR2K7F2_9EUKA
MNQGSYFRIPPPLSNEPPIKISTADVGKIIRLNPATNPKNNANEGNPGPYPNPNDNNNNNQQCNQNDA